MLAYISIILHLTISLKSDSDCESKTNSKKGLYFRVIFMHRHKLSIVRNTPSAERGFFI